MKVNGKVTEVRPAEGREFPACTRCFLAPTVVVIRQADTASMMKAKILGVEMPKTVIVLRPCDHTFPIESNSQAAKILGMEWTDEDDSGGRAKRRTGKKRRK